LVFVCCLCCISVSLASFNIPESKSSCPLGYFPCGNLTVCLPQLLHCNGEDDCGNQADEENCGDNNGWPHLFDKYFGILNNNFGTRLDKCLLGTVPGECSCRGLEMDCDDAQLQSVPSVSTNVTKMSLQRNRLRKLNADIFYKYHNLQKLYLKSMHLIDTRHIIVYMKMICILNKYLSYNKISYLKPGVFQDLHKLEWLILENNKINRISSMTFAGLKSLVLLVLLNNSISHLHDKAICQEMPRLNWLDLEGNHIQSVGNVTFSSCNMLTVLVLQRNSISKLQEFTFSPLQKLGELDLSNNRIQTIPPNLFMDLNELLQLNISYNPILEFQTDLFDNLHKLKSLSIEGIEIANIQRRMFEPLKNLTHIYSDIFQYYYYFQINIKWTKPIVFHLKQEDPSLSNLLLWVEPWAHHTTTCYSIIFAYVITLHLTSQGKNKIMVSFHLRVCCADCLMGVYLFVIGAFDLKFRGEYNRHAQSWMDSVQCQLVGSLAMLSTEVSVLLLTYLTLEKYICIVYPFRYLTPGKCQTMSILIVIWILGFVIAFIPLVSKDFFRNFYGTNGVCFPLHSEQPETMGAQVYSVVIFLGLNLVAFIIIVFCYGSMFYNIQRTGTKATEYSSHIKKEVTIAKRFFFIVFTDSLCWIPIFILKVLSLLQVEIPGTISSWVVIFILPINSALNPILYTLTTRPFKETLLQVWNNYRQRRSLTNSQSAYTPSFTWLDMWPLQETNPATS
uniref:Relaxin family peptide receptor 1 n=1 Tax=Lepisosteus oculatus TaxID=7918 RepID=W5MNA3_LEPOC